MVRHIFLILTLFSGVSNMVAQNQDAIDPVTGLPESVLKPLIERQVELDQGKMVLRTKLFSLFAPVMPYESDEARERKQALKEAFFMHEEIPTRDAALAQDRELLANNQWVPTRWFTFRWSEIVGTPERPSFAPELLTQLRVKGWGDDNGEAFDQRARRARNLLVFLQEQEKVILPLARTYGFNFLGTGRHSLVLQFDESPEYVCKILRNKWAFPFQSISRAFWADTLARVITEYNLHETVMMPEVYLVNIHGLMTFTVDPRSINWPATQLYDHNYVVVEKFINNFPTKEQTIARWKAVTPELVCGVARAIQHAGIWDVRPTTVDLIPCENEDGEVVLKAHFTHLECPGRGGYTARDFYRRTPEVTARLAQEGIKGLLKMVSSRVLEDPRVIEAIGLDQVNDELTGRGERVVVPNELGM